MVAPERTVVAHDQARLLEDLPPERRALLAQFNKSNPDKQLKQAAFPKPLHVEYGSWAVQKGNSALVKFLNSFICKAQSSGKLASIYKATEGTSLPPIPPC